MCLSSGLYRCCPLNGGDKRATKRGGGVTHKTLGKREMNMDTITSFFSIFISFNSSKHSENEILLHARISLYNPTSYAKTYSKTIVPSQMLIYLSRDVYLISPMIS